MRPAADFTNTDATGGHEIGAESHPVKTTILAPDFLLPRPQAQSLAAGLALAIVEERIAQIDEPKALRERWPRAEFIALPGCIVMPGLVNAHQHGRGLSQIVLGYRDDFLETWIAGAAAAFSMPMRSRGLRRRACSPTALRRQSMPITAMVRAITKRK
jgi:imidazolonepropionase-like amidohydrolase